MQAQPANELAPEELDELENLLGQAEIAERAMDVSMLYGFLTALQIGPQPVPVETWLPWVWDCDEGEAALPATLAGSERLLELVLRVHAEVEQACAGDPAERLPLWETWENAAADNWCRGFLITIGLYEQDWEPLLEEHVDWLAPVLALAEEEGEGDEALDQMSEDELDAYYGELFDQIQARVTDMQGFWQPYRLVNASKRTIRRETPKVGRNEPCPCGSGRKFKNCCGAS